MPAEGILNILPTIFVAGVSLKVVDRLFPSVQEPGQRPRQERRKDVYSPNYVGKFGNVGWR